MGNEPPGMPTEEELRAALERITVADVLTETMQGLASVGYHKLAGEKPDPEQTRLAIEALRALNDVLRGTVPNQLTLDFAQVIANLQLAYAGAVAERPKEDASG